MADARITPLTAGDPSWASLGDLAYGALVTAVVYAVAIVAFGPGLIALLKLIDRTASKQIDAWSDEEAPRSGAA